MMRPLWGMNIIALAGPAGGPRKVRIRRRAGPPTSERTGPGGGRPFLRSVRKVDLRERMREKDRETKRERERQTQVYRETESKAEEEGD